jgi:DNA-binding NtrC family response regulator
MSYSIKRILLVDDEAQFVNTLKRHLKREGFQLESACDGVNACQKIENNFSDNDKTPIDLVITDVIMPNMNGFELLQWIQKNYPAISVLLITGFGDEDTAIKSLRPKLDAQGKKPITPQGLMKLVNCLADNRRNVKAGRRIFDG